MLSFTEQLRLIDDADLTPYQFRLLLHYWRVGRCWESVRTTASKCGMSAGQVSQVRRWLLEQGWIEWQPVVVRGRERQAIVLKMPDDADAPDETSCDPTAKSEEPGDAGSGLEANRSQRESEGSASVRPVNAILIEPNFSNGPKKKKREATAKAHGTGTPEPDLTLAEMVNALSQVTGMDGHYFFHELAQTAGELLSGGYTAAEVLTFFDRSPDDPACWNWYTKDWRGKKGEWPTLKGIWEKIAGARRWQPPDERRDWLSDIAIFEE